MSAHLGTSSIPLGLVGWMVPHPSQAWAHCSLTLVPAPPTHSWTSDSLTTQPSAQWASGFEPSRWEDTRKVLQLLGSAPSSWSARSPQSKCWLRAEGMMETARVESGTWDPRMQEPGQTLTYSSPRALLSPRMSLCSVAGEPPKAAHLGTSAAAPSPATSLPASVSGPKLVPLSTFQRRLSH